MCSGPHKRTTLTTGGKWDRQKPKPNRKPRFFLQNLPKPTDSKIFETVTTLISWQADVQCDRCAVIVYWIFWRFKTFFLSHVYSLVNKIHCINRQLWFHMSTTHLHLDSTDSLRLQHQQAGTQLGISNIGGCPDIMFSDGDTCQSNIVGTGQMAAGAFCTSW